MKRKQRLKGKIAKLLWVSLPTRGSAERVKFFDSNGKTQDAERYK